MRLIYSLLALGLFAQCKPQQTTTGGTTDKTLPVPFPVEWANTDWEIINLYDEVNKKEHNLSAAPFALHFGEDNLQIQLDKNKCTTTYTSTKEELTTSGLGCTRMCCDGEAGKQLAALMNMETVFRLEQAMRDGMLLLKSPKLSLRLRQKTTEINTGKPRVEGGMQVLRGEWFFSYYTDNGKMVKKYPNRKYSASFADGMVSVRRDVNSCSQACTYTETEIVCPEENMACTKICCDTDASDFTALFKGKVRYSIENEQLILRVGTQEWALGR